MNEKKLKEKIVSSKRNKFADFLMENLLASEFWAFSSTAFPGLVFLVNLIADPTYISNKSH